MAIAVNIFVKDTQSSPQPIQGVVINAYDPVTLLLVATATTDVDGLAAFLLDGTGIGTMYELRSFKSAVLFDNPKRIEVVDPLGLGQSNDFDISGTLQTIPVATDPRMCRCTGQFVNFSGRPIAGATVRISQIMESGFQAPKVLDAKMVAASTMSLTTDVNGKVSLDLIRGGEFYVTFSGEDEVAWNMKVPDRSSVNLIDLIHPQPVLFEWNQTDAPGNVVSVAFEESKVINFTITFSDFEVLSKDLSKWIEITNSDGTKADVEFVSGGGYVTVTGVATGTCNVTVALKPSLRPFRVPDYALESTALAVYVDTPAPHQELFAHWSMEDTVNPSVIKDFGSGDNDLAVVGVFPSLVAGKVGTFAREFMPDVATSALVGSANAPINDTDRATLVSGSYSFACWLRPFHNVGGTIQLLLCAAPDDPDDAVGSLFHVFLDDQFHGFRAGYSNANVNLCGLTVDRTWTHLAITFEVIPETDLDPVDGIFRIYQDGVKIAEESGWPPIGTDVPGANWQMGGSSLDPNPPLGNFAFAGQLDDVRLYKKTLSDAEVLALATA